MRIQLDNPVARIILNHGRSVGMDLSNVAIAKYDGVGRADRIGLNFTEVGTGVRASVTMYDRGHSAASNLKPGMIDFKKVFARGVRWLHTGGIFTAKDDEGHWEDLKKLAHELHDLSPVFLSPSIEATKFSPANAPISVCLKQSSDRLVLLAANRGGDAVEVTFSSTHLKNGSAKVVSENREVNISDGQLRDKFEPYAVHVYELPR